MKYGIDGNQVFCTYNNFRDLKHDPAGFGDSLKEAFLDLIRQRKPTRTTVFHQWEMPWYEESLES